MQKLYQKSELLFSLAWILLYIVGSSIFDSIPAHICPEKACTLVFHLLLSAAMLAWIRKTGLMAYYGLCAATLPSARFLYYIPLAVLASCNLWFGAAQNLPPLETALYMCSMLCVGFLEEVVFRGFLFKAMSRDNVTSAIIVSSLTFGIGHIINLFNGSGAELLATLCQVVSAIAFGFLFVIIFHRGGSLLPCILTHSILNALSVFANEAVITPTVQIGFSAVLTLIAASYTVILLKTLPNPL